MSVHNERVKLTAAWLNGMSIAAFATGIAAPIAAVFLANLKVTAFWLGLEMAASLFVAIALHLGARFWLGRLK